MYFALVCAMFGVYFHFHLHFASSSLGPRTSQSSSSGGRVFLLLIRRSSNRARAIRSATGGKYPYEQCAIGAAHERGNRISNENHLSWTEHLRAHTTVYAYVPAALSGGHRHNTRFLFCELSSSSCASIIIIETHLGRETHPRHHRAGSFPRLFLLIFPHSFLVSRHVVKDTDRSNPTNICRCTRLDSA